LHVAEAEKPTPEYTKLIDLASTRLGGLPLLANDEFFAEKENLVKPGRGVFIPEKYTDRGKWMDGWETRRRRTPGHDWCIVRLGLRGSVRGVDIDTNHFLGNHPPYASLDACRTEQRISFTEGAADAPWTEILPQSPLLPGSQNFYPVASREAWTHVRLNIYPDGGVARLRIYGDVQPDFARLAPGEVIDLAAVEHGGLVLACNDMFFGPKDALIMPGRGLTMGDGWETRRKRQLPGHDWVLLRLGAPGTLARLVVDTAHFKGNFPDRCSVEGRFAPGATPEALAGSAGWQAVLAETRLEADKIHAFGAELKARGPFTHLRLNIYPDGGVSRLRAFGTMAR
jgi:allantoicase